MAACKCMLEEGLTVVCLEAREDIGGVWLYSDDPNLTTVMKSTCATSSSTTTEMSDFPMPKDIGEFPHNKDMMNYLRGYAAKFNLMPHIKVNSEVKVVTREGDMWITACIAGQVYTSKYIIVATGANYSPNLEPRDTILKGFTGKVYHSQQIKTPIEEHRGQRLLVLGGGETSSDICTEWRDQMEFIYWSIPRGQHFFRKYTKILPWGKPQVLDKATSRILSSTAPFDKSKPGLGWVCKWTAGGSLLAYQGHGIPEWRNDAMLSSTRVRMCSMSLTMRSLYQRGLLWSAMERKSLSLMAQDRNLTSPSWLQAITLTSRFFPSSMLIRG